MSDWSDNPPVEPGWYWLKQRNRTYREIVAQFRRDRTWNIDGMVDDWDDAIVGTIWQYGPRALSPAEITELHKQIAELKATCIAYETDEHGMRHTLGAALGYPQDEHGEACVGNTTAVKLAEEAARKIAALTEERNAAEAELEAATQRILDQEVA